MRKKATAQLLREKGKVDLQWNLRARIGMRAQKMHALVCEGVGVYTFTCEKETYTDS
jgi:ABC-type molybdenum transport system ATPase subunit/photorepair protein PhrA